MEFNFYENAAAVQIIAHICIAFLFLYRGVSAIPEFQENLDVFLRRKIPFPRITLIAGLIAMFAGGLSVLLDAYILIGAPLLILFVVLANWIYHDFWNMAKPMPSKVHLWIFCNNVGVTGGLLLLIVLALDVA